MAFSISRAYNPVSCTDLHQSESPLLALLPEILGEVGTQFALAESHEETRKNIVLFERICALTYRISHENRQMNFLWHQSSLDLYQRNVVTLILQRPENLCASDLKPYDVAYANTFYRSFKASLRPGIRFSSKEFIDSALLTLEKFKPLVRESRLLSRREGKGTKNLFRFLVLQFSSLIIKDLFSFYSSKPLSEITIGDFNEVANRISPVFVKIMRKEEVIWTLNKLLVVNHDSEEFDQVYQHYIRKAEGLQGDQKAAAIRTAHFFWFLKTPSVCRGCLGSIKSFLSPHPDRSLAEGSSLVTMA